MQNDFLLRNLRSKIPFLRRIREEIYFRLSTKEFYFLDYYTENMRISLELAIGQYVMTYRKNVFNLTIKPEQHLCANIQGAKLNKKQLEILKKYEKVSRGNGVTFVVYEKPLQIIDMQSSVLYQLYKQKRLI